MHAFPVASVNSSQVTITSSATEVKHEEEDDLEYIIDSLKDAHTAVAASDSLDASVISHQKEEQPSSVNTSATTERAKTITLPQNFPDSYDSGAVFLKSLLDSFYLKKLQDKTTIDNFGGDISIVRESINESTDQSRQPKENVKTTSSTTAPVVAQNAAINTPTGATTDTCSTKMVQDPLLLEKATHTIQTHDYECDKTSKIIKKCSGRSSIKFAFALLTILLLSAGVYLLYSELTEREDEIDLLYKQLNLAEKKLREKTHQSNEQSEQISRLQKKNAMLLKMADKVVEEEKRNCDFFDVFSIFTSTIGSKKEKNLQELCHSYYRYSELEHQANPTAPTGSPDSTTEEATQDNDNIQSQERENKHTTHYQTIKTTFTSLFNQIKQSVQELPLLINRESSYPGQAHEEASGQEQL